MSSRARPRRTVASAQPAVEASPAVPQQQDVKSAAPDLRHLIALWVCSLIPYLNSFRDGLSFDNSLAIRMDPRIQAATWANLHTIFTTDYWYNIASSGLFRPLTTLSYLFNYSILGGGVNTFGYHVFNSALQAMNVALVYLVGLAIFEEAAPAFATAALWSVHPLLTESVTNIVGRADQLAAIAVLAGLLFHIRAGAAKGRRKLPWLAAIVAVVALGMFSKESSIVVIAVMLIYDLACPAVEGWMQRAGGYAAAAVPILYYFSVRSAVFTRHHPDDFPAVDNPLVIADFFTARMTAIKVLGKYLWMYIWPARLSSDYSYNQIPLAVDWKAGLSLLICAAGAAAAVVCLRQRRRMPQRAVFFFVAFFFVTMAPTSNVFMLIGAIMAERFVYLPSIGLAALLVMGILAAARRLAPGKSQAVAAAVVAVLSLAFAARTFARNFDWFDDRTLSLAALNASPDSFKTHLTAAHDELESPKPNLDFAIAHARRSVEIVSTLSDADSTCRPHQCLGEAWRRKGDSLPDGPERQSYYQKALDVLLKGEKIDQVAKERISAANLAHGLRVMSVGWEPLYLELGRVYLRLNQPDKAVEALRYGCSIKPHGEFYDELSRAYRLKGDNRQAEIALLEGLVNDPSVTLFASELVALYTKAEPQSCAVRRGPAGASLDLSCPLVHEELCAAARNATFMYSNSGRRDQAIVTAQTAVREMGCPVSTFK
jgi:tetratricopeptide (TPR) repeat protein